MEYEIVVGLEIHCELQTKSKIFCGCSTTFGAPENTNICPVCLGLPGTLPVLNKKVVEYAVRAGLALNCEIPKYSKMDRKNYFYPDLPKAYQVSQFDLPIVGKGKVHIKGDGFDKFIGISRIHIEEDAGKLIHTEDATLSDNNRGGVPLIEIVTEPDMRSAEEARAFAEKVKMTLEYAGVSDCKMQEGSLRFDVNLSVRPKGSDKLGVRTELKNLNSFRSLERAIISEAKRHIREIEKGNELVQETRKWDDEKGMSFSLRDKEEAHDYRYFPDPDLVPIVLDDDYIENIRKSIPKMPWERVETYIDEWGISEVDAEILTVDKAMSDYFEETVSFIDDAKTVANWLLGDVSALLKEADIGIDEVKFSPKELAKMIKLIKDKVISGSAAKTVIKEMFENGGDPEVIVKEKGLAQVNDEDAIKEIVLQVMEENPKSIEDIKNGKDKAIGFLVGQVMKKSKGKANPQLVNKLIRENL